MNPIQVSDLLFSYGDRVAVNNVSFEVKKGEVFGFLGPNGAGKSTTIKILTTLLAPKHGEVYVLGYKLPEEGKEVRKRIGVVLQEASYEYSLNVEDSLDVYGLIWDIPRKERRKKINTLLAEFDLEEYRHTHIHDLSIGMKRRVQVAREFMHDMDLLFLDEPTVGMDVIVRRRTLDTIKELASKGLTVFFTTHILEEADYICDRIAVINKGKIVAIDRSKNLKELFGGIRTVDIRVDPDDLGFVLAEMRKLDSLSVNVDGDIPGRIQIATDKPLKTFQIITQTFEALNIKPISVSLEEPSLEQVFMNLVDKENRVVR
ncbi:MAG: ABC transporter ATP-binding protein [Nitrososphaerota archaeon]